MNGVVQSVNSVVQSVNSVVQSVNSVMQTVNSVMQTVNGVMQVGELIQLVRLGKLQLDHQIVRAVAGHGKVANRVMVEYRPLLAEMFRSHSQQQDGTSIDLIWNQLCKALTWDEAGAATSFRSPQNDGPPTLMVPSH